MQRVPNTEDNDHVDDNDDDCSQGGVEEPVEISWDAQWSVPRRRARGWSVVLSVLVAAMLLDVILSSIYIYNTNHNSNSTGTASNRNPDDVERSANLFNATLPQWKPLPEASQIITKVAFGSCASQEMPQPHWDTIVKYDPNLFLLTGDNVYGDCSDDESCRELRQAYRDMARHASVQGAAPLVSVYATLDDHDYGCSDCHGNNPHKELARELFAAFFGISPAEFAPKDGVYRSSVWGPDEKKQQRLQIILLDTRYDRSPFQETGVPSSPYTPSHPDSNDLRSTTAAANAQMLSEKQWQWLKEQLEQPAELRVLVSSVQVLNDGTGFEAWRQLPSERDRLYELIRGRSVILLSGDRHVGGFYEADSFMEVTASSLTHTVPLGVAFNSHCTTPVECDEVDPRRVGDGIYVNHFGSLEIDWTNHRFSLALRRTEASLGSPYWNTTTSRGKLGDAGQILAERSYSFPF